MRFSTVIAAGVLFTVLGCGDASSEEAAEDIVDDESVDETQRAGDIIELSGNPLVGATIYAPYCQACHGVDGVGIDGFRLSDVVIVEGTVNVILFGRYTMPAFESILSDQDIADVLAFIQTL